MVSKLVYNSAKGSYTFEALCIKEVMCPYFQLFISCYMSVMSMIKSILVSLCILVIVFVECSSNILFPVPVKV